MTARNARTRIPASLFALALMSAALRMTWAQSGPEQSPPHGAARLLPLFQPRAMRFVAWLGDGGILVATGSEASIQIARVPAAGAAIEPLSFASQGILEAAAHPYTSGAFAYVAAEGPAVDSHAAARLYLQRRGEAARVIESARPDAGPPAWAHDGSRLAFVGDGERGVLVIDTQGSAAASRQIVAAEGACWHVLGWSIDDHTLLLGRSAECTTSGEPLALYQADVASGDLSPVLPFGAAKPARAPRRGAAPDVTSEGIAVLASSARFASDGHAILLLTRAACQRRDGSSSRFRHLCRTDPATGEWRQLSAVASRDVELFDASPDGRWIAFTLNEEGSSRLMLLDRRRELESAVSTLASGVIHSLRFDPAARELALTYESPRSAPDVYVLDPLSPTPVRWTDSDIKTSGLAAFVDPQIVRFPTWDQADGEPRQLSALLYGPLAAPNGPPGPRPVVIWLCGGGAEQCRPRYAPFVQYLVQKLGVAVLAPNVRGSSGYGTDFEASGSGPLRDDAVRDVGSLLVWIGLQPGLDRAKVALMGEGFGSYLALASLAQFGDRLSGAVAAFPRRQWSLPNALAIRRPVLLVQDPADPNVPSYQVAQLREGLRASGVAVQYLAAGDASDSHALGLNREAYHEAVATFLGRVLR